MENIKFAIDSTGDLSPAVIEKYDLDVISLNVLHGSQVFTDGVDITPKDIFRYTAESGELCKTSAVNVETYKERFSNYLKDHDYAIQVVISDDFSSCYENATNAAAEFGGRVAVINSKNLSTGMALPLIAGIEKAKEGASFEETVAYINSLVPKVEASFVIDTLDYLKKGGRCSSVKAFGAAILGIKPCIEVTGGKMTLGKTYKGSLEKCIRRYILDRLTGRDDIMLDRIFITHTCLDNTLPDFAESLVRETLPFNEIIQTCAGSTVACHCGPGTLGILFVRK